MSSSTESSLTEGIPQEILDRITDSVAQKCPASLSNLSLSSHHFLHRAQSHIFHTIWISKIQHLTQLLEIADLDSAVFAHMRTLHLDLSIGHDDTTGRIAEAVLRFANYLRHLRGLHLEGGRKMHYLLLSPVLRTAVEDIMLKHPISHLSVHDLQEFPVELILPLKSLQALELAGRCHHNRLILPTAGGNGNEIIDIPWELSALKCDEGGTDLLPFTMAGDKAVYSKLVSLDLAVMGSHHHKAAWAFLEALSGSPALRHLALVYSEDDESPEVSPFFTQQAQSATAFPTLPSLLTLRLTLETYGMYATSVAFETFHVFMAEFPATILAKQSQPSLEVLEITHVVTTSDWTVLDYGY
ncbi:hypothetical protein D9611_008377 [Ephemerocybe angulata]|uniref:Uncharacterized protein n=1 Tax=Ephemerocybe angulata TaxID=980116 RepID=A0A8H5BIS1_9AGAR|nr:hypothetical protein D9611_008377 [Tulosesus angulatus]